MWSKSKREAKRLYKANILNVALEHAGRKRDFVYKPIETAEAWSVIEMAAHYYDFKGRWCMNPYLS
ncbi:hypothetical protein ACFL6U_10875 [Planctomycetota bacterium]